MSFESKDFWILKNDDHATEGNATYNNASLCESKRSHDWFSDSSQPHMYPNKKQAAYNPVGKSNIDVASEHNLSGFPSVSNQFMDQLFGAETPRSVIFSGAEHEKQHKIIPENYGGEESVALSISNGMGDSGNCFAGNGISKLRVNRIKDITGMDVSEDHTLDHKRKLDVSSVHPYRAENENSVVSLAQAYDKDSINIALLGHPYSSEDSNIMSFNLHDDHGGVSVAQTNNQYHSYDQPSVQQTSQMAYGQESEALNANPILKASRVSKPRGESLAKSKLEGKTPRKEAPTSFPSNVRSLISTGMLDGVPVKYVSLSREELGGIIKGSGYLCGCQSCEYAKVLNAYEFERHAGCKTKHPNNHIYFENGKTIYQIVQELRNTPSSLLFDVVQTAFGSPINQRAFRIWKESFQAATRELQRIYGKEEIHS